MHQGITKSIIYGLIACFAFYAGFSLHIFYDYQPSNLNIDYKTKKEVYVNGQAIENNFMYGESLYQNYYNKSENCLIEEKSNMEHKLCSLEVAQITDEEIKNKIVKFKNKIFSAIEILEKEKDNDLVLLYIKDMPEYIDDTYKEWLEYRSVFCVTSIQSSMGGNGYSGFLANCEYEEGLKFMKFLDALEEDWMSNVKYIDL